MSSSTSKPSPPRETVDLCGSSGDDEGDEDEDEGKGKKRLGAIFGRNKEGNKKLKIGKDGKKDGEDGREKFTGDVGDALKVFRVK